MVFCDPGFRRTFLSTTLSEDVVRWKSSYFGVEFVVWLVVVPVPRNDFGGHGKDRDGLHSRSICASFQKDHTVNSSPTAHQKSFSEEVKFAKYPSPSGEDLHLKLQTRASGLVRPICPTFKACFSLKNHPFSSSSNVIFVTFSPCCYVGKVTHQVIWIILKTNCLFAKLSIQTMDSHMFCITLSYFPALIPAGWEAIKSSHCRSLLGLAGSELNCHSLQSCSVAFATRLADGQGGSGMNFDEFLGKWWRWWRVGLGDLNTPKRWLMIGGTL